jgi:hypothetical protein
MYWLQSLLVSLLLRNRPFRWALSQRLGIDVSKDRGDILLEVHYPKDCCDRVEILNGNHSLDGESIALVFPRAYMVRAFVMRSVLVRNVNPDHMPVANMGRGDSIEMHALTKNKNTV